MINFDWREIIEKAPLKIFQPCLDIISILENEKCYEVELHFDNTESKKKESKKAPIKLHKSLHKKGLQFEILLDTILPIGGVLYKESYGLMEKLELVDSDQQKFSVKKNSVIDFKTEYFIKPQILTGTILNFMSNDEDNKAFRRLIVPTNDTQVILPTAILNCSNNIFKINPEFITQSIDEMFVLLNIKGEELHFYYYQKLNAIVIDSINKISKSEFVSLTEKIRIGFAFLSGKYYRDEAYYFSSSQSDFSEIDNFNFQVEEPSIISINQIINPQYFFTHYQDLVKEEQEKLKDYHCRFSEVMFSELCEKLLDNIEFTRAVELLISAGSISNPIEKGALYSVAIETISSYFKVKNEKAFKPISDDEIADNLKSILQSELEKVKNTISKRGFEILTKKILHINQPTNRDKLEKCFEIFLIKLSDEELSILKHRDSYLHGKKPIDSENKFELEKTALELHSLIAHLILKYVKYEGHFIHLPAWVVLQNYTDGMATLEKINPERVPEIINRINSRTLKSNEEFEEARIFLAFWKTSIDLQKVVKVI